ncbi:MULTISPECIES: hypothetical protein [Paraburkholderia]|uniref:hypothetical protein n=1 Tax=Paraburkholderia TaxID=1822464 RepID=UPI002AB769A1|nr:MULTISPECIES: hypothetical protein [Paraburkholderia]
MILELENVVAKITSVKPISEKHGKQRVPAHMITFEIEHENTILIPFDSQLRSAFYQKPARSSVDAKSGQKELDVTRSSDGLTELRFPWWSQWIEIPGELVGYLVRLHTGNTERSHIVLDEAKLGPFFAMPKEFGMSLLKLRAIVHPTAHEKGRIDELLQQEVPITIAPPVDSQGTLNA